MFFISFGSPGNEMQFDDGDRPGAEFFRVRTIPHRNVVEHFARLCAFCGLRDARSTAFFSYRSCRGVEPRGFMGCGSSAPRPAEAADAATREGLVARGFELGSAPRVLRADERRGAPQREDQDLGGTHQRVPRSFRTWVL